MKNHKRLIALILVAVMALSGTVMNVVSAAKLTDANKYTAKGANTNFELADAIDILQQNRIVAGVSQVTDKNGKVTEYTFDGDSLVTRQQFALFTARIATAHPGLFVVAPDSEIKTRTNFKDLVDKTYTLAIDHCYGEGYILGRDEENTIFDPTGNITFAEAVTMLTRALGYTGLVYPTGFMVKASENEVRLIGEYADFQMNNIATDKKITRAQMAMLLWNFFLSERRELEMVYNSAKGEWESVRTIHPIYESFGISPESLGIKKTESGGSNDDKYTVKFDLNYSNPVGKISEQTVKKGGYANRPTTENVKRANYLLTGWYTDKDCKNEFSFETKINADMTLYAKWVGYSDSATSYDDYMRINSLLIEIEKKYYNNDGYVDDKNFDEVILEAVSCVKNLYEQGKILGYDYTDGNYAVGITRHKGMPYIFTIDNPNFLSGGNIIDIKTYRCYKYDAYNHLIDPFVSHYTPVQKIAKRYTEFGTFKENGYSVNYIDYDYINGAALSSMSGDILLWEGHGGWLSESGPLLVTSIEANVANFEGYDEISGIYAGKGVLCITAKFIEKLEDEKPFEGALIYLNTCCSLFLFDGKLDTRLAQAFINKGARVVVGNTANIQMSYARYLLSETLEFLTKLNSSTNRFYTIQEAINKTGESVETLLKTSFYALPKKLGYTGVSIWWGDENFRLTDLVVQTGIESTVLSTESNDFLMGVTVTLYDVKKPTVPVVSGTTDIMGIYKIYCSDGTYNIKFEKDGYETQTRYNIEIKKGKITDIGTISLVKSVKEENKNTATGIESMVLSTEFNDFLMGVTVTLYDVKSPTVPVVSGTTDIMGIYKIYCSEGTYNIKFEKDGYETQTRYNIVVKKGNIADIGNTSLVKSAKEENKNNNSTQGKGDVPADAIHIKTADELSKIGGANSEGKYYVLDNDINLTAEWVPINDFRGTFDGQGHSINNLYILESSDLSRAGLFNGGVKNNRVSNSLTIKNVRVNIGIQGITARNFAGGLVADARELTIENCYVTGKVSSSGWYDSCAGGLVGHAITVAINNSYFSGNVSSYCASTYNAYAGGLIGDVISLDSLRNSYSIGDVSAFNTNSRDYRSDAYAGGLVGCMGSYFVKNTENCYFIGDVSASSVHGVSFAGFLVGCATEAIDEPAILPNCYYRMSNQVITGGQTTIILGERTIVESGTPLTDAQMKNKSSFVGWDFDNIWNINPNINNGYPYLRALPYQNNNSGSNNGGTNISGKLEIQSTLNLEVGDIYFLMAYLPEDTLDFGNTIDCMWKSSDTSVVDMGTNGIVNTIFLKEDAPFAPPVVYSVVGITGVSAGTATITVRLENGDEASCIVTVK